jgi:hypothetical protein
LRIRLAGGARGRGCGSSLILIQWQAATLES